MDTAFEEKPIIALFVEEPRLIARGADIVYESGGIEPAAFRGLVSGTHSDQFQAFRTDQVILNLDLFVPVAVRI